MERDSSGKHLQFFELDSRGAKGFRHPLDSISVTTYIHTRHTRNLSNTTPQLFITSGNNETPPLFDHVHQAVVSIAPLAITWNSLKSWILSQSQSHLVLRAEFLQLAHHAICDARDALGQEAIHHTSNDVHFIPNRKVYEICVHQNVVRRAKLCVVLKK